MNWTPVARPTEEEAERAGYEAGKNGSNTTNTHFRFFGSRELARHDVLAGLNGWHRWSTWAAHFFVNGEQQCSTAHGRYMGGGARPSRPTPAELTVHGTPFGTVCQRCLKVAAQAASAEQRP